LLVGSFALLFVAVVLNIIGLNVGKWLQNAAAYPVYSLLMLVGIATVALVSTRFRDALHLGDMMPHWSWDTVNFWSQIAFAFTT